MAWWSRKDSPSAEPYDPATDEASLDRCVRRFEEVLEEMGPIGKLLESVGDQVDERQDVAATLSQMERVRIPGFCGHKLAVEAWSLMELIAVRVVAIRKLRGGSPETLRKLDRIQALTEAVEPVLRTTLEGMEVYASLDGATQLKALMDRRRRAPRP